MIKASAAGQYRLLATIDDGQGHVIEGGYLLTVTGEGYDAASTDSTIWKSSPNGKSTNQAIHSDS